MIEDIIRTCSGAAVAVIDKAGFGLVRHASMVLRKPVASQGGSK
jgi:hypothetical protein